MNNLEDQIRIAAENDLETFIRLVAPYQVLGAIHQEWCQWTTSAKTSSHQITLLPRDHGKSRMIAFKVAWYVVKFPDIRILYISSTSGLAEKQLHFIKQILESPIVRRYWPELIHPEEGKRAKWTNTEIAVDHPKRKEEGVRDPTVFTGGLTTNLVGMHCDVAVLDDVVTGDNAYTDDGRSKVKTQFSLLSSIEGGEAEEWVVGTRYHPKDLYSDMLEMEEENYDDEGEVIGTTAVYDIFQRQVEDSGSGVGQFIWPRQQRPDGKWFGFDAKILAKKRAKYIDRTQFRAQYYNDPNDPGELRISRDKFQYYDPKFIKNIDGTWYHKDRRLNVFASVDFAYSTSKRADYTAIAVIGVDRENMIYVLEIDRFKTERISDYYDHIFEAYRKWGFRKLAAETTAAQKTIVKDLKENYIRPNGLALSIQDVNHTRHQGSKEERMSAILEPRYDNLAVWHYRGGYCQTLEDELVATHPPHDDCMDALASAIAIAIAPSGVIAKDRNNSISSLMAHPKFGGLGL